MTWLSGCYKKPPPTALKIGGDMVGIAGMGEIMEQALQHLDEPEEGIQQVLLDELKARNYVPRSQEKEYLKAIWKEFRDCAARRKEDIAETYQGIPREEIPWFPKVEESRCEGCSSCVEFCTQNVFAFQDGKSKVVRPYNCVVGMSSCRGFCPDRAISFPSRPQLRDALTSLKEKHGMA